MADLSAGLSLNLSAGVGATGTSGPAQRPFNAFNFLVEIRVDGVSDQICGGAFSECEGLEMSIEPKTIREGGRNNGPVHLMGRVSYGQVTLRRGMTPNFDLWRWFEKVTSRDGGGVRATAEVTMFSADGTEQARFLLNGCLPVRLKAAPLNAKDGQLAIEDMQFAFENMALNPPGGQAGLGLSVGLSAGGAVGASLSASASLDVGASLSGGAGFSIG